jgi:tRNA(Ile2)-agmatinylcytidine synthase
VEKIRILELVERSKKIRNPRCDECDKSMGSMGAGKGFRCKKCGTRAGPERAEFSPIARNIKIGWYEPPVAARRHLYKPLRRMPRVTINKI